MWPASPSWRAKSPGRGVYLKARSFLARLEAEGLVASHRAGSGESYRITPEGERLATRQPIDLVSRGFAEREYDDWMAPLRALALPAGLDDPL